MCRKNFIFALGYQEDAGCYRIVSVMISGSGHVSPQPYLIGKQMEDFMIKFRNGYTLVNLKGSDDAKIVYYKALETSHVDKCPETFQKLVAAAEKASLERYLTILGEPA